ACFGRCAATPPWHDTSAVLNACCGCSRRGAQWRELPEKYPPYQTCHRRFQQWIRDGKLIEVLRLLARLLHEQGKLNLDEAFVDAPLQEAMESRAPLRMDAQLPAAREPVGVPHRKLPRNGPPRMPPDAAQTRRLSYVRPCFTSLYGCLFALNTRLR